VLTDGVVDPHPPVTRALQKVAAKLRAAGHDVIEFKPQIDLWQAALTTWALYFQTGAKEVFHYLRLSGQPPIPQFQHNLKVFKSRELTVTEAFKHNTEQAVYKGAYVKAWDATISKTSTGQPMDYIVCPSATMAGSPHDFPLWWGYFTAWNLIDYPSIIMPFKDF
jgi:amidase